MTRQELSRALVGRTLEEVIPVVSTWNGFCWKAGQTQYGCDFSSLRKGDICYMSEEDYREYSDKVVEDLEEASDIAYSIYTKKDFLDLAWGKGHKREIIARTIFQAVDWQHPETYAYELLNDPETLADIEQEAAKKR